MKKLRIEDFWKFVRKDAKCWTWIGARRGPGYGGFRGQFAHRVSYVLNVGKIRTGLCVCHTCDNRLCVNPAHLWVGTKGDNLRDMCAKGRHARVALRHEKHPSAKLNWPAVNYIRARYRRGATQVELAAECDVTQANISSIVRIKTWR